MKYYVVDAFADKVFEGNPAGVCVMDHWPSDELMLNIAMENNLSETAFAVKEGEKYHLRWFTPTSEVDLCGHATLATAYIILNFVEPDTNRVVFHTLSGDLTVLKKENLFEMNFPSYKLKPVEITEDIIDAIGFKPLEAWGGRDLVCVLKSEDMVYQAKVDFQKIYNLKHSMLHITAKGSTYDCVSRSFGPKLGVNEDPVCGSGHCHIAPLWAQKLNQKNIIARQASSRGGTLYCRVTEDRAYLSGNAVLYLTGDLNL